MTSQFADMKSPSNFFDIAVFFLSNFLVIIMTGCGVMTISIYKGLTRNLEI